MLTNPFHRILLSEFISSLTLSVLNHMNPHPLSIQASFFVLILITIRPLAAQETISQERMEAVMAVENLLLVNGDIDRFIDEWLDPTYRDSMPRSSIINHLRTLKSAVSNAGSLEIEVEPNAVHMIFSEGVNTTITIHFALHRAASIQHLGIRKGKSPDELTPSEQFATARRSLVRAVESIGNRSHDSDLEAFLNEYLAPSYMKHLTKAELLPDLRSLRQVIAFADVIRLEGSNQGVKLEFRGQRNADVYFTADSEEPHLITSLRIDTNVDVTHEKQASATVAPITWDNLEQRLSEETEAGFSGAVLAVRNGDIVLNRGFGFADQSMGRRNTSSTLFDLGSLPIDFTIAGILKLENEGLLSLTDPVSNFFQDTPKSKSNLDINHLIHGQSGLPNFHHRPELDEDFDLTWIDREEAIHRILSQNLLFSPGEQQFHSHSAFVLLAAIIEVASGMTYSEFLRDRFFDPLGMKNTGFYGETDRFHAEQFAVGDGHRATEDQNIPLNWGPTSWLIMGSGGMVSTVEDLYTWIKWTRSGNIVSSNTLTTSEVAEGSSDRGFFATFISNPHNTIIYLTNVHSTDDDLPAALGRALVGMVLTTVP